MKQTRPTESKIISNIDIKISEESKQFTDDMDKMNEDISKTIKDIFNELK